MRCWSRSNICSAILCDLETADELRPRILVLREAGLAASERQLLVQDAQYPVVYLYRRFIDGVAGVHSVIPIAFTKHFVTLPDPLRGQPRVPRRKLSTARAMVQQWAVVVS